MKLLHLLLLLPLLHHLHLPLPLLQPFRPRFVPPFGAGVGGAAAQLSNVDLQLARERLKFRLARERRKFRRARDRLKLELARERQRFRYRYRGQRWKGSYSAPQPSTRKNLEKEEGSVRKKRDRRRGRRRGKWRKSVSRPSLPRLQLPAPDNQTSFSFFNPFVVIEQMCIVGAKSSEDEVDWREGLHLFQAWRNHQVSVMDENGVLIDFMHLFRLHVASSPAPSGTPAGAPSEIPPPPKEPTSLGEFKQLLRLYVASLSAPSGAPTGAPTEIPSPDPPTNSTKCPSPT